MADYSFQTRNMAVGYDGKPLIRDITLGVERGEVVTLIGPNGSGKSTILKSIARQLRMVAGTATIDRSDLGRMPLKNLATRMAVMLTERVKPELTTCRDIVSAGRHPYTGRLGILSGEDEAKVSAAMASVRALDLSGRDFSAISDGQRQRVLLARALCQEPEIIVLDEPTSFLDVKHKLELLSLLRDMAKQKGITVLMSLHEIDLAQKVSDKILCVKGETIARYGTPEEVFDEAGIRALYEIDRGHYDPRFGGVELPRVEGEPGVLVLSACGTGIPVYRALQKRGAAFCAGILYENDVDCHLARQLAVETITERPFYPIGDAAFSRAMARVQGCDRVIDAGVLIGPGNLRMRALLESAGALGKLEKRGSP